MQRCICNRPKKSCGKKQSRNACHKDKERKTTQLGCLLRDKQMIFFVEKCLAILTQAFKMSFRRKPTYSSRSTLKLYLWAAITNRYIESIVAQIAVLAKLRNGHGCQSGDTALRRIAAKSYNEVLEEARVINRTILHKAKRRGAFRRKVDLAIDYHTVPRYTKKRDKKSRKKKCDDLSKAIGIKPKRGAFFGHVYATIEAINVKGERYTIDFLPVCPFEDRVEIAKKLLISSKQELRGKVGDVYADGDFDHVRMINMFDEENVSYIVRAGKTKNVEKELKKMRGEYFKIVRNFVLESTEGTAITNLVIVDVEALKEMGIDIREKGKRDRCYTYFTDKLPKNNESELVFCVKIARGYRHRWGIETGYSEKNLFLAKTHSLSYSVRLWLYLLAILMYNLWLVVKSSSNTFKNLTKYQFIFLLFVELLLRELFSIFTVTLPNDQPPP